MTAGITLDRHPCVFFPEGALQEQCVSQCSVLPKLERCARINCLSPWRLCKQCLLENRNGDRSVSVSSESGLCARHQEEIAEEKREVSSEQSFAAFLVTEGQVLEVPVKRVRPFKEQPRQYFDQDELQNLATSIKRVGQLQPVLVRKVTGDPEHDYELVDGERRWRACDIAGIETIRIIVTGIYERDKQFLASAVANFGHAEHADMEIAQAIDFLRKHLGWTLKEVAEAFGKTENWASQQHSLLKLDPRVQAMLDPALPREKRLAKSSALLLSNLPGDLQVTVAEGIISQNLSGRDTEIIVRKILQEQGIKTRARKPKPSDSFRNLRNAIRLMQERATTLLVHTPEEDLRTMLERRSPRERRELEEKLRTLRQQIHDLLQRVQER